MKRIIAAVMAVLLLAVAVPALAAEEPSFRFPNSGKLKVMLLADAQDIHYGNPYLKSAIEYALDQEQPDLVLLLGDQIDGHLQRVIIGNKQEQTQKTIDYVMAPIVKRGIPFAVVFGNHDSQTGISREWQMAHYQTFPNCLAVDEGDSLPGCGTYHIPVYSSDGERIIMDFCMIDTRDHDDNNDYIGVSREQVEWFRETAYDVPTYIFQHIIVEEVYELLEPANKTDANIIEGKGNYEGQYFHTVSKAFESGLMQEAPSTSVNNEGQFAGWVENGNVVAAFFGHDHVNSFIAEHSGIKLVSVPGSTYSNYNNANVRGVRMLLFDEAAPQSYETYLVNYAERGEGQGLDAIRYFFLASGVTGMAYVKVGVVVLLILLTPIVLLIIRSVKRKKRRKRTGKAG